MDADERIRRVLVAYDGSPYSRKALGRGCEISRRTGARLVVVHVYALPLYPFVGASPAPVIDMDEIAQAAKQHSRRLVDRAVKFASERRVKAKGVSAEFGSPVEGVIETASKEDADLIIVGTHGLTGFRKLLLGSVSSGVLSHARCDVLVVR